MFFFRWCSLKEAVGSREAKETRLTATVKKVRKYVLETRMESNPQLWITIILWFDFQGFKILIDGCVNTLQRLGDCSFIIY